MTRLPPTALAALLLLAVSASADSPAPEDSTARIAHGAMPEPAPADPVLGSIPAPQEDPHAPLAGSEPVNASRGSARAGFRWFGVFADGMQFRVPRNGIGLDLQGGAYLQLLRNLSLRGSYRVFDYDLSEGDSSFETDYHGPLFGLNLSF